MDGITAAEYNRYRWRNGEAAQDVRLISQVEGRDIYTSDYWLPRSPGLSPGLDLSWFDTCVNCGPGGATRDSSGCPWRG